MIYPPHIEARDPFYAAMISARVGVIGMAPLANGNGLGSRDQTADDLVHADHASSLFWLKHDPVKRSQSSKIFLYRLFSIIIGRCWRGLGDHYMKRSGE
jgi:hypothetical protein